MSPRAWGKLAIALSSLLVLSGCLRGCDSRRPPIHLNPNMDDQPRYDPLEASGFFYSGSTSQAPVPGTIARGELPASQELTTGRSLWGFFVQNPLPLDEALLARGKERFGIFCDPCHGPSGNGHGKLYERTKVEAANLLDARIHQMPDGKIFDVITNGSGLMQDYRHPIPMRDRWAIVAYVRALQASR